MLETVAMVVLAVWALGLISGNSLGGAIHVLLLVGLLSLYFHHRAAARARSIALENASRMLNSLTGPPTPSRGAGEAAGPEKGRPSRPSAAA